TRSSLEGLEEGDQVALLALAERSAKIVAAVHLEVGAAVELEQRIHEWRERSADLLVTRIGRQGIEVPDRGDDELVDPYVVPQAPQHARLLRAHLQVRDEVDRRPGRDVADVEPGRRHAVLLQR